jgi:hypothetical protein
MREVKITPVLNGFIVQVGCQMLVYSNMEDLTGDLIEYQSDPEGTEALFRKNAVNPMETTAPAPPSYEDIRGAVNRVPRYHHGHPLNCEQTQEEPC